MSLQDSQVDEHFADGTFPVKIKIYLSSEFSLSIRRFPRWWLWRSYTRAHTGPGPGEFLSALVNHARSTYLNRNGVAVYRIMSCRIKLPMPLRPGKLDLLFRISHLFDLRAGGRSLFIICY